MRRNWLIGTALFLCLVTSLSAGASAERRGSRPSNLNVTMDSSLPVHPYLQYGAQVEPNRRVRMIVQTTGPGNRSAAIAGAIGASVKEDFRIASSMVIEAPQRAALKLAKVPNVRYITYDGPATRTSLAPSTMSVPDSLQTSFPATIRATELWTGSPETKGSGITVAVLDTGLNTAHGAMGSVSCYNTNPRTNHCGDVHGHGTHVVGTINGADPLNRYVGIAPQASVIAVKVADDDGMATESDVIRGLQWVFDNRITHNIRVVSISASTSTPGSYITSPIAAAVETLWLNGVVVVAAAGNRGADGDATWFAPGNDPFVISVGALDENGTASLTDDSLASFSSRGQTMDGHYKPELVAPGRRIVAPLAGPSVSIAQWFPERITDSEFIRLTGTSMSAPVVAGAVALLLERHPQLTPDQVKWVLMNSTRAYPGQPDSAGLVDAKAAVDLAEGGSVGSANQGLVPSNGVDPTTGEVDWDQLYWDQLYWDQLYWDQLYWDSLKWDMAG